MGGGRTFLEGSIDHIISRDYKMNRSSFIYCGLATSQFLQATTLEKKDEPKRNRTLDRLLTSGMFHPRAKRAHTTSIVCGAGGNLQRWQRFQRPQPSDGPSPNWPSGRSMDRGRSCQETSATSAVCHHVFCWTCLPCLLSLAEYSPFVSIICLPPSTPSHPSPFWLRAPPPPFYFFYFF